MQVVPDRSDKGEFVPVFAWLPMLRETPFANHPVIRGAKCPGLRISEIETSDVDLHEHALKRQGRSTDNGTGAIRCIIDGSFPFPLPSPRLAFTLYGIMTKSISARRKTRGRPATGTEPMFGLRISNELMAEIAKWAEKNETNRSEAIRRLVELGLKANK
jgi:hypothetical protein